MKKNLNLILGLVFLLLLVGCTPKQNQPEFLLRASHLVGEDHTWYKAFQYFGEILEERSSGRIVLQNYHSEQLAKEVEAIRMIQAEVIDMTITSAMLSSWVEVMVFCEMPFMLQNPEDVDKLVNGPLGERIRQEMISKAGLRPVGYFRMGTRHLTSNRPIKHPDDLKGLIIRVPNVPAFVKAWEALGAKATPMAFSEVFTSLQQGTIEAQENPFAQIKVSGFYEVQDYLNLTGHVVSWVYPLIGEKQFQKFPDDLKEIFLQAAADMQAYEKKLFMEYEKNARQELEALGMTFVEVDNKAFIDKCGDAIFDTLSPEMQEIYTQLRKDLKQ